MTRLLEGKVIIITGAANGIGRAAALLFASEGAKVVAADMDKPRGGDLIEELCAAKGDAIFVQTDVSDRQSVLAMIQETKQHYGRLDGAFNNAGIEGALAPTADYPDAEWDRVLGINARGIWCCMSVEIPLMLEGGGGAIVNTASNLGLMGARGMAAYVASKHAVIGVTRSAALDYASKGIRVNALAPGVTRTPMMDSRIFQKAQGLDQMLLARSPMGRFARPHEIAECAAWLLSDRASFVTGHCLVADGAYLIE